MKGLKECTTLCYLERGNEYLVMYRGKKENDENSGKYIGVGGHLEKGETPEECAFREIREETGLMAHSLTYRGLITFVFPDKDELAFLYTTSDFGGTGRTECEEGSLRWVDRDELLTLPIWEGDAVFLKLLRDTKAPFSVKLVYENVGSGELKLSRVVTG